MKKIIILLKIFITGGAGFIGRHLTEFFLKNNKVCIYDNLSNSSNKDISQLVKNGADFVKGDILDYEYLKKSCSEFDVVIHLAAISDVKKSTQNPEMTEKVNVSGTTNVLKCCVENNIKKIIFSSSAAVYGNCKIPISEKSDIKPISTYGVSKMKGEKQINEFSNHSGLNTICLRLFNVYGKGQNKEYAGVISKFLDGISEKDEIIIYGDGEQTRDFISIKDVVKAFHCAIKKETTDNEIFNIASGKSITIKNLATLIASIFNKKIKINYKLENKHEIKFSEADIALAQKDLGFNPEIKLEKGLRDLVSISH
ncbi:MAG: NAD-dependent epimerase/dehydratase family protein [Nitrosopumilus sp.]|nr:NAD-dependent epimerase/dehydratase family protein [Nitrosopumilus sp.]